MKKLLSTVLALACVSSMAITSFAATAPTNVSDSSDSVSDYVMPRERLYYIKDISCGSASWKPQAPIEMKEGYGLKVQFWSSSGTIILPIIQQSCLLKILLPGRKNPP